ncbi:18593_t:CDS:1 [Acaulospora morrowiae]|uniref:18593_t:CDS:1 n=1 Tax=Acaulospora morrowiae TaxID=94023 RepID=A0A9N9EAA8_9GLOM|nr:18593_t:CDS:1 [Acaulospora morrowiae]
MDELTDDAINNLFPLKLGWALKNNQILDRRDVGKRMSSQIREYLEEFFLAGNANKTDRISATQMVKELDKLAIEDKIESNDISGIPTVEKWITRYTQALRHEVAAEKQNIVGNNNEERSDNLVDNPDQSGNSDQNIQESRSSSNIEKR